MALPNFNMHVAKSLRLILFVSPKWNLLYMLLAPSPAGDKRHLH